MEVVGLRPQWMLSVMCYFSSSVPPDVVSIKPDGGAGWLHQPSLCFFSTNRTMPDQRGALGVREREVPMAELRSRAAKKRKPCRLDTR